MTRDIPVSAQVLAEIAFFVRRQVEQGRATRLELNLAQLSTVYAQRALDDLQLGCIQAQALLHAQLGVVSSEPIVLRGSASMKTEPPTLPDPVALAQRAIGERQMIKAAYARILQRDQAVRIEKSRRWPWLTLSGRYRHTESTPFSDDLLLGAELSLPMIHLQPGPLLVAQAERDREQAVLDAQVQALQQSVYAAHGELKLRLAILLRYQREILPVLVEHENLLQAALAGAQVDLVALLSSEENVLRGQREFGDARLAYRRAVVAPEAAVGVPLQEVAR